jgi:hypothetical protein
VAHLRTLARAVTAEGGGHSPQVDEAKAALEPYAEAAAPLNGLAEWRGRPPVTFEAAAGLTRDGRHFSGTSSRARTERAEASFELKLRVEASS